MLDLRSERLQFSFGLNRLRLDKVRLLLRTILRHHLPVEMHLNTFFILVPVLKVFLVVH